MSNGCPAASAVGTVEVLSDPGRLGLFTAPLYNMVAPPGAPAELGFDAVSAGIYVHLLGGVRTGSDYGLSARSNDILARATDPGSSARRRRFGAIHPTRVTMPSAVSAACRQTLIRHVPWPVRRVRC